MAKVPTLGHGAILSRYRIESLLGAGGMGEVYRAVDLNLGRPVALKILTLQRINGPQAPMALPANERVSS